MELDKVICGKMEVVLKDFPDNFFHSIVTDPPYGLKFMGKKWDYDVPSVQQWQEALRVLKPGGHLLSFGGTRTYHRMVINVEDAGFEIRNQIAWIFGSGFPKSLDISKAIDKAAGVERKVVGKRTDGRYASKGTDITSGHLINGKPGSIEIGIITEPSTDAAKEWEGWGTALKPAIEPICVARKPLSEPTVIENVLKHGTGGINIDATRIESTERPLREVHQLRDDVDYNGNSLVGRKDGSLQSSKAVGTTNQGRFPSNLILDKFMADELDKQSGILTSGNVSEDGFVGEYTGNIFGKFKQNQIHAGSLYGDSGGASRFFYVAKPSQFERNKGLRGKQKRFLDESRIEGSAGGTNPRNRGAENQRENFHPTVKPIELMRYLVKMITPKGGICLDPFCGSGTTLIACKMEEMNYVGIDMEQDFCDISEARIKAWYLQKDLFNE